MVASAAHDGYRSLKGRPQHRRSLEATDERGLSIVDDVHGSGRHHLQGGLLLHPDWSPQLVDDRTWLIKRDTEEVTITVDGPAGLQVAQERATYHPEFGLEQETVRLVWRCHAPLPVRVTTRIADAQGVSAGADEVAVHVGAQTGTALETQAP